MLRGRGGEGQVAEISNGAVERHRTHGLRLPPLLALAAIRRAACLRGGTLDGFPDLLTQCGGVEAEQRGDDVELLVTRTVIPHRRKQFRTLAGHLRPSFGGIQPVLCTGGLDLEIEELAGGADSLPEAFGPVRFDKSIRIITRRQFHDLYRKAFGSEFTEGPL